MTAITPYSLILTFLYLVGLFLAFRYPLKRQPEYINTISDKRIYRLLWPIGFSILCLFLIKIYAVIFDEHSWIRFQKTFIFALGHPLYYGVSEGPALATIYGPVSVLLYLPATIIKDAFIALRLGESLAILWYFFPVGFLFLRNTKSSPRLANYSTLLFYLFCILSILLTSLRNAAFTVHADAPTLGLCVLACASLLVGIERQQTRHWIIAALFASLAVWSKQVAVPIVVALPLFVLIKLGWAACVRFTLLLGIVGLSVSGLFVVWFGFEDMYFNMFSLPGNHPLKEGSDVLWKASRRLLRESLILVALTTFPLVLFRHKANKKMAQLFRESPASLFFLVSFLMMPIAILSSIKVGGSNNTLSYGNYFFVIGCLLTFQSIKNTLSSENQDALKEKLKNYTLILALVLGIVLSGSVIGRLATISTHSNFAKQALSFIEKHPGESYFPRLTLLHLLYENKRYHTTDGLMDRHWAGQPVTGEHLKSFIPENLKHVGYAGEDHQWLYPWKDFEEKQIKGLEGFRVYQRKD